ncbi:hypothetical protein EDC96DRAFT_550061 [Choanephora cucurbitarum]|nr:hypothetical protein EDC96DRAFT_550061 [Choanephora cucurbitarum]
MTINNRYTNSAFQLHICVTSIAITNFSIAYCHDDLCTLTDSHEAFSFFVVIDAMNLIDLWGFIVVCHFVVLGLSALGSLYLRVTIFFKKPLLYQRPLNRVDCCIIYYILAQVIIGDTKNLSSLCAKKQSNGL